MYGIKRTYGIINSVMTYFLLLHTVPAVPDMTLVAVNSSAIQVTWQEPEVISMPDEDILGYKLSFHKLEEEPKLMILVPEQRQKTITKLG